MNCFGDAHDGSITKGDHIFQSKPFFVPWQAKADLMALFNYISQY